MLTLKLSSKYSRREVHSIFSPETKFTPQAGSWGLHGIIPVPDRPRDFVFFVTFGKQEGDFEFDESVSGDGVLTWQSQPKQKLTTPNIQSFITHDELLNNIYLFFRNGKREPYQFMGRLKYLAHDPDREQPVHFQWQLLDWDALDRDETLNVLPATPEADGRTEKNRLVETPAPQPRAKLESNRKRNFNIRVKPDYAARDASNRKLGLRGELLVLDLERSKLIKAGKPELAELVLHVSEVEGDGAGYDIRSYNVDGSAVYVEVKTTTGGIGDSFFMSANELAFAKEHASSYRLARVFSYNGECNSGGLYVLDGEALADCVFTPTNFRVAL